MDLDYNGYPDYADTFVSAYIGHSDDREIGSLQNFYKCYYAYVRGKVISFRLGDNSASPEDREEEISIASRYFDLAYTYSAKIGKADAHPYGGTYGNRKECPRRLYCPPFRRRNHSNRYLAKRDVAYGTCG